MHQSHATSPPLVLTNIISQLKGWGVVPLKAPKAIAGRLQYHLANWERVTKLHQDPQASSSYAAPDMGFV